MSVLPKELKVMESAVNPSQLIYGRWTLSLLANCRHTHRLLGSLWQYWAFQEKIFFFTGCNQESKTNPAWLQPWKPPYQDWIHKSFFPGPQHPLTSYCKSTWTFTVDEALPGTNLSLSLALFILSHSQETEAPGQPLAELQIQILFICSLVLLANSS